MAKKILVIDDEIEILQLIKRRLESNHFLVITAENGKQGLIKLKQEKPELIILDIVMPEMDGLSFVHEVKSEENYRNIPIIIITAKEKMKDIFEAEGITDFIVKPFDSETLMAKVNKYIR